MKTRLTILQMFIFCAAAFSQGTNSCIINNAGFELGNTTGWICKSGYYGAAPCPPLPPCPRMGTVYTGGAITSGTVNAILTSAADRHTMMSTAGGNDANATTPIVPVVAPGGGTYSFRLGNGNTGAVNGTFSQAEAIRLTFNINNNNASFTYRYAFFVNNPGHAFESQPSFEVVVLDQNDAIIPCGRYFVVAGTTPAGCVNSAGFVNGNGGYVYKGWTDVGLDLTGYIGQNVSIEFRTTDCIPSSGGTTISTSCSGSTCTYCINGNCCTYASPGSCTPPPSGTCNYAAGNHSAYAYIDAYCAPLSVQAPVFCAGTSSIQICAPAGYVSYSWPAGQPGMTGSPGTQCVTITNPVAGNTYTVNMTTATGCPTKTQVTLMGATPSVNSTTICAGQPTTLTATGGSGTYSWSPGASTSSSIVISPSVTTTYTVTSAATGTLTCPASATGTVTVGNMAATVTPPVTICPGGSTTITATGSGTGSPVYNWSSGQSSSSIVVNPATTTIYTVSITNGLCTATGSTTVTVAPITVTVSPPTTICLGSSTSFTATGGGTYSWNTGDLTAGITVTPTASTSYSVVVTNGAGCTDIATTNVTVNSVSPTITPPVTICAGDMATITAGGGGTYVWSNSSISPTITISPATTTTYSVTVTNGGCSSTLTQTITVNPFIIASVNTPPPVCFGNNITLIASGGTTYSWSDGSTSPTLVITSPPVGTSNYSVIVSSGSSCIDTAYTTFTVNPLPIPTITPPVTICLGTCVTHTAGGGTTYVWSNGSTSPSIVVCTTLSTNYTVLITDANGCTGTASTDITVNPFPAPTVSSSTICAGASATLTATGGTTYTWSNGQIGPTLVVTPGGTTTYTVNVTSTTGCNGSAFGSVTVVPSPTAVFSNSAPCEGSTVSFTDGSLPAQGDPILTWSWSLPGGAPGASGAQHPVIYYPSAGTYTASLVITSQTGCIDTVAQTVIIYARPIALFAGNDSACASLCHTFLDNSQAVNGSITSWYWTFPGGNPSFSTSQNPTICYNSPGAYGASLVVTTNYGCKDTFAMSPVINVYSVPTADFCVAPTQASITDPTFKFCDLWTSDVSQWFWTFGDGDSDFVNTDPIHSYSAGITYNDFYSYTVCLNVRTIHGCWDSICKTVELIPEFTFYIPNTFTPNGNGVNEFFFGKGRGIKEYDIWIFDRWGNLIWDCHYSGSNVGWDVKMMDGMSSACKWDGTVEPGGADMSGRSRQLAQEDVYVWKVKLIDVFSKKHSYVGHVSIVK